MSGQGLRFEPTQEKAMTIAFKDDELKLNELDLVSGGGFSDGHNIGGKSVSAATSAGLNHPQTQGSLDAGRHVGGGGGSRLGGWGGGGGQH
jgi:hypothetical protein